MDKRQSGKSKDDRRKYIRKIRSLASDVGRHCQMETAEEHGGMGKTLQLYTKKLSYILHSREIFAIPTPKELKLFNLIAIHM